MKPRIRLSWWGFLLLFLTLCSATAPAEAVGMPAADRRGAERLFLLAYQDYLQDRPWSCMALLAQALKKNTYMVDTYLLRALAQRRVGLLGEGAGSLEDYLEVRRQDVRIRRVATTMREEQRTLRELLYPRESGFAVSVLERRAPEILPLPLWNPLVWSGLAGGGKLRGIGDTLFLPDTLGNRVHLFELGDRTEHQSLSTPEPAVILPLCPSRSWILGARGKVHEVWKNPLNDQYETKPLGDLGKTVTDAVFLSSKGLAVADRLGNQVHFFRRGNWVPYASWSPEEKGKDPLFEPVALDLAGPFLAVADRGRGEVHVLDVFTLQVREVLSLPLVRDVAWNHEGGLFLLTEDGKLYRTPPLPLRGRPLELLAEGLEDAWSLSLVRGRLFVMSQGGRRWWVGDLGPDQKAQVGFLSLDNLRIEKRMGMEWLRMEATPGSPFPEGVARANPQVHSVWQNDLLTSTLKTLTLSRNAEGILALSPEPVQGGMEWGRASRLSALWASLERRSRNGKPLPPVLLLDSRLRVEESDCLRLLGFALLRGIRVDLLCRERPAPLLLDRVRRLTGGVLCVDDPAEGLPPVRHARWEISLPLPARDVPFGTPSEALLSVFGDALTYQFRDCVPLWPNLVPQKR